MWVTIGCDCAGKHTVKMAQIWWNITRINDSNMHYTLDSKMNDTTMAGPHSDLEPESHKWNGFIKYTTTTEKPNKTKIFILQHIKSTKTSLNAEVWRCWNDFWKKFSYKVRNYTKWNNMKFEYGIAKKKHASIECFFFINQELLYFETKPP